MNYKFLTKRLAAYVVDFFIVFLFTYLFTISAINPQKEKYINQVDNYSQQLDEYYDFVDGVSYMYDDVSNTDYEELLTIYPEYDDELSSIYEDGTMSQDEYSSILDNAFDKIMITYKTYLYKTDSYSIISNIFSIVLLLIYFGIIPALTKGQTIGKKIFKLKIVKKDNTDAKIFNYLIRSLI